jgi:hypothetical protein
MNIKPRNIMKQRHIHTETHIDINNKVSEVE